MILALINYQPLTYHNGNYKYPAWAHSIGWGTVVGTLTCIPGYAIFNIVRANGATLKEVKFYDFLN